jgi:hypothetical protein
MINREQMDCSTDTDVVDVIAEVASQALMTFSITNLPAGQRFRPMKRSNQTQSIDPCSLLSLQPRTTLLFTPHELPARLQYNGFLIQ